MICHQLPWVILAQFESVRKLWRLEIRLVNTKTLSQVASFRVKVDQFL